MRARHKGECVCMLPVYVCVCVCVYVSLSGCVVHLCMHARCVLWNKCADSRKNRQRKTESDRGKERKSQSGHLYQFACELALARENVMQVSRSIVLIHLSF